MVLVVMNAKFPLGDIIATPGALEAMEQAKQSPMDFIGRHAAGDWGELDEEDKNENEFSLNKHLRLLSAYRTSLNEKLWIITEADRSATTILLPSEY